VIETWVEGRRLSIELFSDQGVARFRLLGQGPPSPGSQTIGFGVALGGALGAAIGSASAKKEGLLGGVVLGMLIGGLLGAVAAPVDRALALRFDPATSTWRLYDGPLLSWAKRTLIPA
jgi:drug/metabolite transporter (DMT)-like permease